VPRYHLLACFVFDKSCKAGLRPNWNVGMVKHWKIEVTRLGDWIVGLMAVIALTGKCKMDNILLKPIIPSFHYSIIP
jgi:hypothetical protein